MGKMEDLLKTTGDKMLESLLGGGPAVGRVVPPGAPPSGPGPRDGCKSFRAAGMLDLARILPDPDQPRKEFDQQELDYLTQSIQAKGVLQPLRVRWDPVQEAWVLIVGERRYRAAQQAGLVNVPVVMVEGALTAAEILEEQLIENIQRDNLKPLEAAQAYQRLMQCRNCSARDLAETLKIDPATVSRALALLKLPAEVQAHVEAGSMTPTQALELAKLPDQDARELAQEVVDNQLNAEQTREAARQRGKPATTPRKTEKTFRASNGGRVVVTFARRADAAAVTAALLEAVTLSQPRLAA